MIQNKYRLSEGQLEHYATTNFSYFERLFQYYKKTDPEYCLKKVLPVYNSYVLSGSKINEEIFKKEIEKNMK